MNADGSTDWAVGDRLWTMTRSCWISPFFCHYDATLDPISMQSDDINHFLLLLLLLLLLLFLRLLLRFLLLCLYIYTHTYTRARTFSLNIATSTFFFFFFFFLDFLFCFFFCFFFLMRYSVSGCEIQIPAAGRKEPKNKQTINPEPSRKKKSDQIKSRKQSNQ